MSNYHPLNEITFNSLTETCAIEASAGTGKTWTIERLYIKSLLDRANLNLENILVVTFTNNAANELKIRIIRQINETINHLIKFKNNNQNNPDDPFIKDLLHTRDSNTIINDITVLTRAKQSYDRISIFTIHGFCSNIIKDFQTEFNINTPIQITSSHDEILLRLIKSFYKERILDNKIFSNDLWKVTKNIDNLFETDFETTIIEKLLAKLPKNLFIIENGISKLAYSNISKYNLEVLREDLQLTPENINSVNLPDELSNKKRLTKDEINTINKKRKIYFLKVLLSELIVYISNKFDDYRKLGNRINYDELIQIVSSEIKVNKELSQKIFKLYPIAFIDEFQDTDSNQWEIFKSLYSISENSTRGHLIVVGDPKQAIYRFRGADINTYFMAIKQINKIKFLSENRRSHPHILNFINHIFNPNYQTHNSAFLGDGIQYQKITAKVDLAKLTEIPDSKDLNLLAQKLSINHNFYNDHVHIVSINNQPDCTKEEAIVRALTFEILALLTSNEKLNAKIAILVCKNYQATIIVEYLKKYGIKSVELKLSNIYTTNTAQQLWNILDSIKDLSKKKKFNLAISGDIFNFDLSKLLFQEQHQIELESLYQNFYSYKHIFEQKGILSLIYKIIEHISSKITHGITNRELSNLTQLGELLNKKSKQLHNPYDILPWFKNKIEECKNKTNLDISDNDDEEIIRLDNDDEQIVVMTQHTAKGLEYEILFCPFFNNDSVLNNNQNKLPLFISYQNNKQQVYELIDDEELANKIIKSNNSEIHRLNYVTLTRAKSRIYIYLSETTKTKTNPIKYFHKANTNKIDELFGYIKSDPNDMSHMIFNYPLFFTNPEQAIKEEFKVLLPSVVSYKRNVTINDLDKLNLNLTNTIENKTSIEMNYLSDLSLLNTTFTRQSYSSITSNLNNDIDNEKDYFKSNDENNYNNEYTYEILNSPELKGAKFGLLFHELCENYPLNVNNTNLILNKHSINIDFVNDYINIINEALNYKLGPLNLSISSIDNKIHELEFNLKIKNNINISELVANLLIKYYGETHPFSISCKELKTIDSGYLKGYIDLFFFANDKFWILDYKTNELNNYSNCNSPISTTNEILLSMAENHYYLQYLIYLVAVKRYLEQFINIEDSSSILGGAIYFYVKGVYVTNKQLSGGIYFDDCCQSLISDLDQLFL